MQLSEFINDHAAKYNNRSCVVFASGPSLLDFKPEWKSLFDVTISINTAAEYIGKTDMWLSADISGNIDVTTNLYKHVNAEYVLQAQSEGMREHIEKNVVDAFEKINVWFDGQKKSFDHPEPNALVYGNSGLAVFDLCARMNFNSIVLIGFDGGLVGENRYWHNRKDESPCITDMINYIAPWEGISKAWSASGRLPVVTQCSQRQLSSIFEKKNIIDVVTRIQAEEKRRYSRWASFNDIENAKKAIISSYKNGDSFESIDLSGDSRFDVIKDCKTALDFGCGIGRNFPFMQKHFSTFDAYDLPNMTNMAQQHASIKPRLITSDWELIKRNKYDVVVAILVLQHIPIATIHDFLKDFSEITQYLLIGTRSYMDGEGGVAIYPILLQYFKPVEPIPENIEKDLFITKTNCDKIACHPHYTLLMESRNTMG